MRHQSRFRISVFSIRGCWRLLALLGPCIAGPAVSPGATAQIPSPYIPATNASENSPVCSTSDIGNDTDLARLNPKWKAVNGLNIDPSNPVLNILNAPPTILEGVVPPPSPTLGPNDQPPPEVSAEDIMWKHYTHDFTFKGVPDQPSQGLLSSRVRFHGTSFLLDDANVQAVSARISLGGVPTDGRCVVLPEACSDGTTGDTYYRPVTGAPVTLPADVPNSRPTAVAVTETDAYASGNSGGANDLCMILAINSDNDCKLDHSASVIPVNNRNSLFDVYLPGMDYTRILQNGTSVVPPPASDSWAVPLLFLPYPFVSGAIRAPSVYSGKVGSRCDPCGIT